MGYVIFAEERILLFYVHISPPFKCCRREMLIASLCAFHAEDSFGEENKIGAVHIL